MTVRTVGALALAVAALALPAAATTPDNAFKVELGRRTVLRALQRGAS